MDGYHCGDSCGRCWSGTRASSGAPLAYYKSADDVSVQYFLQTKLIYPSNMPSGSRTEVDTPASYSIPFEDLSLTTPDGVAIKAYLMMQQGEKPEMRPTVVLLHANAGNGERS